MAGSPEEKYLSKLSPGLFNGDEQDYESFGFSFFPSFQEGRRWWNLVWNLVSASAGQDIIDMQYEDYTGTFSFPGAPEGYEFRIAWNGVDSGGGSPDATLACSGGGGTLEMYFWPGDSRDPDFKASSEGVASDEQVAAFRSLMLALVRKELLPA